MKNITRSQQKWLKALLGKNVLFDEPISRHSTFRAGGRAAAYALPDSIPALRTLLLRAAEKGLPCCIIGGGSNLLVTDSGFDGIFIDLSRCLRDISLEETENTLETPVRVQAGVGMKSFCRFAIRNRLEGIQGLLGIPGTVGGGIRMNAGTALGDISDILESVRIMSGNGEIRHIDRKNMDFRYRTLSWSADFLSPDGRDPLILEGIFRLRKSRKSDRELKNEARIIIEKRKKSQPWNLPSAGCFFRNPPGRSAGEIIDRLGLKGKMIGGAAVSQKHANFIVNRNNASASDILVLGDFVKNRVFEKSGIELQKEVKVIGLP